MNLTASDLVQLKCETGDIQAGIQYASRSLHYTYNRMHLQPADRLRKIVVGKIFERAFQRWLTKHDVKYDFAGETTFDKKDRYDIGINGRACDLKSYLLRRKDQISQVESSPARLLKASALVPLDQITNPNLKPTDIYIFGFITGQEARDLLDLQTLQEKDLPHCLLHVVDQAIWQFTANNQSPQKIILKSNARLPNDIQLGGLDEHGRFVQETLKLNPQNRVESNQNYTALFYVRPLQWLDGELGITYATLHKPEIISPNDWQNIWLYGRQIFLCGWMNKREFRKKSERLPAGGQTLQYTRTKTINCTLPIQELRPMADLLVASN